MTLEEATVEQLKAAAYDQVINRDTAIERLRVINEQLIIRHRSPVVQEGGEKKQKKNDA